MFAALKARKWPELATVFFLVVGIALRLRQFSGGRSLALDEATLSLHIIYSSFQNIIFPSEHTFAPPVFLLLEKGSGVLFGYGDVALRVLPLLAGIASLFIFYLVAIRFISARAVPLAMAFFSLCPKLIFYSSVVKQYSTDVMVALLAYLLAARLRDECLTPGKVLVYGLAGALALWFSLTAVFILSAAIVVECIRTVFHRQRGKAGALVVIGAIWVCGGVSLWALCLRTHHNQNAFLYYWRDYLSTDAGFLPWIAKACVDLFSSVAGFGWMWLAGVVAFLSGCAGMFRAQRSRPAFLLGPLAILLLPAWCGYYPLTERFLLFIVPAVLMAVAEGFFFVRVKGWANVLIAAAVAALLFVPVQKAAAVMAAPVRQEEIKDAIRYWKRYRQPEDSIYLYYWAIDAFYYYEPVEFESSSCWHGAEFYGTPRRALYRQDLDRFPGSKRVWVLFSHEKNGEEKRELLRELDMMGSRQRSFQTRGASVYLYYFP